MSYDPNEVKQTVKWLRSGLRRSHFARYIPSERRKADAADLLVKLSVMIEKAGLKPIDTEGVCRQSHDSEKECGSYFVCIGNYRGGVGNYSCGGGAAYRDDRVTIRPLPLKDYCENGGKTCERFCSVANGFAMESGYMDF